MTAFYELKEMVSPDFQDKFQAVITQKEDQTYLFSFSIEGIIDKYTCVCGQGRKKMASIKKYDDIPEPPTYFLCSSKKIGSTLIKSQKTKRIGNQLKNVNNRVKLSQNKNQKSKTNTV